MYIIVTVDFTVAAVTIDVDHLSYIKDKRCIVIAGCHSHNCMIVYKIHSF